MSIFHLFFLYDQFKNFIKEDDLIEYFGNPCEQPKTDQVAVLVSRDISKRKKKMNAIFKKGRYFSLSDSTVQCLLKKNETANFWYATELEKYPAGYRHIELLHESTPILGYFHVAIINEKGRIESVEKFGYGI